MSPPDERTDLEIEFPVCRCAAPASLADQLMAHFATNRGVRVRREGGPNDRMPIQLVVSRVQYMEVNVNRFLEPAPPRGPIGQQTAVITTHLADSHAPGIASVVTGEAAEAVAELVRDAPCLHTAPVWMPVFDVRTFVRTGIDLYVASESDADRQLDAIAPALKLPREEITIKPPPGWAGYGHPDLFPRQPRSR